MGLFQFLGKKDKEGQLAMQQPAPVEPAATKEESLATEISAAKAVIPTGETLPDPEEMRRQLAEAKRSIDDIFRELREQVNQEYQEAKERPAAGQAWGTPEEPKSAEASEMTPLETAESKAEETIEVAEEAKQEIEPIEEEPEEAEQNETVSVTVIPAADPITEEEAVITDDEPETPIARIIEIERFREDKVLSEESTVVIADEITEETAEEDEVKEAEQIQTEEEQPFVKWEAPKNATQALWGPLEDLQTLALQVEEAIRSRHAEAERLRRLIEEREKKAEELAVILEEKQSRIDELTRAYTAQRADFAVNMVNSMEGMEKTMSSCMEQLNAAMDQMCSQMAKQIEGLTKTLAE